MLTLAMGRYIDATLEKTQLVDRTKRLLKVHRRLRPGDLATVDNARSNDRAYVL